MNITLTGVVTLVQTLRSMGLTGDALKEGVSWFVGRFGTGYTDAQKESLVNNGISYEAQLAQLDSDIAEADVALNPPPQD